METCIHILGSSKHDSMPKWFIRLLKWFQRFRSETFPPYSAQNITARFPWCPKPNSSPHIIKCFSDEGGIFYIWTFIWKLPDIGNFSRALNDAHLFSYNHHVGMGIQLGWGHLSVVFISHCGCLPNHRNIRNQRSIGFDHRITLIGKWFKPMSSSSRPSRQPDIF